MPTSGSRMASTVRAKTTAVNLPRTSSGRLSSKRRWVSNCRKAAVSGLHSATAIIMATNAAMAKGMPTDSHCPYDTDRPSWDSIMPRRISTGAWAMGEAMEMTTLHQRMPMNRQE